MLKSAWYEWELDQDFVIWLNAETKAADILDKYNDDQLYLMYQAFCAGRRFGEQCVRQQHQHAGDNSLGDI